MDRWNNRVALVTGASKGIGAAICQLLVESGMVVVGVARNISEMHKLVNQDDKPRGKLIPIACDVTNDDEVRKLFAEIEKMYGGVDVCINNAGRSFDKDLLDGTPEEWRAMMDLNVIALCMCSNLAVNSMIKRKVSDGHIINISSILGHRVSDKEHGLNFYTGTKFAVRAISEGYTNEIRKRAPGIKVSTISPGVVNTPFFEAMLGDEGKVSELLATYPSVSAKDVANGVIYALSTPIGVQINDLRIDLTGYSVA